MISRWLYNVDAVTKWAAEPWDDPQSNPRTFDIKWWDLDVKLDEDLRVGEFIGQGRQIQFCGLPHAFLEASKRPFDFRRATESDIEECARKTAELLDGWKPRAWYVVSMSSFLLVWCAIMSAFVVSFNSPTVGFGCRTFVYLLFGAFSSVSWCIQFSKRPPEWALWISYIFNALAIMTLLVVVIFQASHPYIDSFALPYFLTRPR